MKIEARTAKAPVNNATLEKLLEIGAPWSVIGARFDEPARQLEVHVGIAHGGWLGSRRAARQQGVRGYTWRHLALGTRRVRIMLECPIGMSLPQAPWAGSEDSPFSAALSQRLLLLFGRGASLVCASSALDLDLEEVWQFKHRLDGGKLGPAVHAVHAADDAGLAVVVEAAMAHPSAVPAVELPDADHGIWRELVSGSVALEIGHLGLQLFLARLRMQFAAATDEDARSLSVQALRRYFESNARAVAREITALQSLSQ